MIGSLAEIITCVNLRTLEAALEGTNTENRAELEAIRAKIYSLAGVKAQVLGAQALIVDKYVKKVGKDDEYALKELRALSNLRDALSAIADKGQQQTSEERETYSAALRQIQEGSLKDLLSSFSNYEKAYEEKERVYFFFAKDSSSESLDTFKTNLLKHLAGSIVVKEHRQRYQKEQYDRLISSLQMGPLGKNH